MNVSSELEDDKKSEPSDEEMRKLLKPVVSEDQVVAILKQYWAADGQEVTVIRGLDSYDDVNYMVKLGDTKYLFKVHNGVESNDYRQVVKAAEGEFYKKGGMKSVIHLQTAIMTALERDKVTTSVPVKPVAAKRDSKSPPLVVEMLPVASDRHSPCLLVCRLLTFVPGRPMSDIKLLPLETLCSSGKFLGRLDRALDRMIPEATGFTILRRVESRGLDMSGMQSSSSRPADGTDDKDPMEDESLLVPARRFHQWDGKNTVGLSDFVHCIQDDKRRGLVESIIDSFQKEIIDSGDASHFRKGINHGDFNDANIILDNDLTVFGVIDFGDSTESWRVLDVSVAMAYGMLSSYGKANRSISAAAAILRGYNSTYALTSIERKHLVLLIACRLACSCTLGAYSFQQNPTNRYLLLHAEPAWKAMELIWCYDVQRRKEMAKALNRVFDQACLYTNSREKIIECHDLVLPDPNVCDLLQDVRISFESLGNSPVKKRRKLLNESQSESSTPPITFVTGNAKKLEEVQRILGANGSPDRNGIPFHITNQKIDLPELQGEAIQIAKDKCAEAAKQIDGPVIIEDTSLCFNALNGMPGVYIKWFLDSCGLGGLNSMLAGFEDKSAYAQTVVAFCAGPGKEPAVFDGRTKGTIVPPRGELAFGWDPIFQPEEGGGKTYAEMSKAGKDAISHRSRAFAKLRDYLTKFQKDIALQMN